jgi:hypothetical protein
MTHTLSNYSISLSLDLFSSLALQNTEMRCIEKYVTPTLKDETSSSLLHLFSCILCSSIYRQGIREDRYKIYGSFFLKNLKKGRSSV